MFIPLQQPSRAALRVRVTALRVASKLHACRELELARRPRRHRLAEQRRAQGADKRTVVDAVRHVERIETKRDLARLLAGAQLDAARRANVERRETRGGEA